CLLFLCSLSRRPTTSPLFPYTTLFRSLGSELGAVTTLDTSALAAGADPSALSAALTGATHVLYAPTVSADLSAAPAYDTFNAGRSEEHTSELQSRENLVCRLLLEKKKM